jgi:hypothetical protein
MIDFQTDPSRYRHWRLSFDGPVATLTMDVDPDASLFDGCELKLNSYDLGVDVELADAVQRLRFEHPEVRCVVLRSGKEGVFCAGANIRMLAKASHGHKVNFCKFTNETRLAIEDACANSGQRWLAAVSGSAAGGGYELAMAAEHIMLIDDRRSGVALPEMPLLAVLPATGGLTRLDRGGGARPSCGGVAAGGRGRAAIGVGSEAARACTGTRRTIRPTKRCNGHHAGAAATRVLGRQPDLFACACDVRPRRQAGGSYRAWAWSRVRS